MLYSYSQQGAFRTILIYRSYLECLLIWIMCFGSTLLTLLQQPLQQLEIMKYEKRLSPSNIHSFRMHRYSAIAWIPMVFIRKVVACRSCGAKYRTDSRKVETYTRSCHLLLHLRFQLWALCWEELYLSCPRQTYWRGLIRNRHMILQIMYYSWKIPERSFNIKALRHIQILKTSWHRFYPY